MKLELEERKVQLKPDFTLWEHNCELWAALQLYNGRLIAARQK